MLRTRTWMALVGILLLAMLAWNMRRIVNLSYYYREALTVRIQELSYDPGQARRQELQGPHWIAHAGGVIQGRVRTNSLEALDFSYQRGFRVFEVDLSWTSDGELVCIHDWNETARELLGSPGQRSSDEFVRESAKSGLQLMRLADLIDWLKSHPDAYWVTDIKEENLRALAHIRESYPRAKDRIIPQVYFLKEVIPARKLGFEQVILTLYRANYRPGDLLEFLARHPVTAVTMDESRATGPLPRKLRELGIPTFAHTINDPDTKRALIENGVFGFYTDSLGPSRSQVDQFKTH